MRIQLKVMHPEPHFVDTDWKSFDDVKKWLKDNKFRITRETATVIEAHGMEIESGKQVTLVYRKRDENG